MHTTRIRSREVNPAGFAPGQMLRRSFDQAVESADPMRRVPAALPPRPDSRVIVVGAGKASGCMAEAVWRPCEGLVITRDGYSSSTRCIETVSDVANDGPSMIASDPTIGDTTIQDQARDVLRRWDIQAPAPIVAVLSGRGARRSDGDRTNSDQRQ